jgi:hypothetical protein
MGLNKFSLVIFAAVLGTVALSPAWAKKNLPAVNDEGMELVKDSELAVVYADPDADLSVYNRIWLKDAEVSFKKNWLRDQNRGSAIRVRNSDMNRIQEDVSDLFREVFTEELSGAGYVLVEEIDADVLVVKPAIVDLDVVAPDIQTASRSRSFSEQGGEMTLKLTLFDSVTNDKIAEATDRKQDYRKGYVEWRTSVNNRALARRMMKSWAKTLRTALDEARSTAP